MSSSALQIALLMLLVPQNVLERRKKGKYLPVLNFVNIIKYLQVVRFFKIKSYGVFFSFLKLRNNSHTQNVVIGFQIS